MGETMTTLFDILQQPFEDCDILLAKVARHLLNENDEVVGVNEGPPDGDHTKTYAWTATWNGDKWVLGWSEVCS
jgi:hypothetical protein